jgi:hypothetical protein
MPEFKSKEDEFVFIEPSKTENGGVHGRCLTVNTYHGPTEDVLPTDALSAETGRPFVSTIR